MQGLAGQPQQAEAQGSGGKRKRRAGTPPGGRRGREAGHSPEPGETGSRLSSGSRAGTGSGGPPPKRSSNNKCEECGTSETPTWRRDGPTLLCNACGLRRKKNPNRGLLQQQQQAAAAARLHVTAPQPPPALPPPQQQQQQLFQPGHARGGWEQQVEQARKQLAEASQDPVLAPQHQAGGPPQLPPA